MKSNIDQSAILKIANALGKLNESVVYVGGAIISVYINDTAAEEVRETLDIDISVDIASLGQLEKLRQKLSEKGFKQSAEDNVLCRFRYEDIMVDVMSTEAIGWAPGNRWFKSGFKHLEKIKIKDKTINILPLDYFLASKFDAYHDRGEKEPRTSKDLEDITYLIDNRKDLDKVITNSHDEVKLYLIEEFKKIIDNKLLHEAILGNLYYETQIQRFEKIIESLKQIIKSY